MLSSSLVFIVYATSALARDYLENTGVTAAVKLYKDCMNSERFLLCLKAKAITYLDRLSRMEKIPLTDGVFATRDVKSTKIGMPVTEKELEANLLKSNETLDQTLNHMLLEKMTDLLGSRTFKVALPKIVEEGRGHKNKKKKNQCQCQETNHKEDMIGKFLAATGAKLTAMIPIALAAIFLIAGKAMMTAKIALLLSGIIGVKNLFNSVGKTDDDDEISEVNTVHIQLPKAVVSGDSFDSSGKDLFIGSTTSGHVSRKNNYSLKV